MSRSDHERLLSDGFVPRRAPPSAGQRLTPPQRLRGRTAYGGASRAPGALFRFDARSPPRSAVGPYGSGQGAKTPRRQDPPPEFCCGLLLLEPKVAPPRIATQEILANLGVLASWRPDRRRVFQMQRVFNAASGVPPSVRGDGAARETCGVGTFD